MSDRMIELMREKMMGRGGAAAEATPMNGGVSVESNINCSKSTTHAATIMENHDKSLCKLLSLVSSSESSQSHSFTTPPSLSKRILNRQGCGYIDPNISSLASLASDYFLSNILHNSSTCQSRRIKGQELLQKRLTNEKRIRKRSRKIIADSQNKIQDNLHLKEHNLLNDITAGEACKKSSASVVTNLTDAKATTPKRKKVKKKTNGKDDAIDKNEITNDNEEDEISLCKSSQDHNNYLYDTDDISNTSENDINDDDDEDEEEKYAMHLRDIARPLQKWDINFIGKIGFGYPYHLVSNNATKPKERNQVTELDATEASSDKNDDTTKKKSPKKISGNASVATAATSKNE